MAGKKKGFDMSNRVEQQTAVLIPTSADQVSKSLDEPIDIKEKQVTKNGLYENEARITLIADKTLIENFYNIAYEKRLKIKEAANEMFKLYIDKNKDSAKMKRPTQKRR